MKKRLQPLVTIVLVCLLLSCKATFQVMDTKTTVNTPEIGIEWNYGENVHPSMTRQIDSILILEIESFNAEFHAFKVRRKEKKDKDYVSIEFNHAKIIGSGGKIVGYTVTTIGILAIPATIIATEGALAIGFYYWPTHSISSRADLSPNLAADKRGFGKIGSETGALFSANRKQVPKLYQQLKFSFKAALIRIEQQLVANAANANLQK